LPDGRFSDQKSQFGYILEKKMYVIFYGHLEYFKAIWYIVCPVSNFVVVWYIFKRLGKFYQEKSGNPAPKTKQCRLENCSNAFSNI
jgi:hypothetical protein